MKIFAKYKLIKLFFITLFLYVVWVSTFDFYLAYCRHLERLEIVTQMLITYALEHQGRLPISSQEFELYSSPPVSSEAFEIYYGIQLNVLYKKKGKLYDSQGNKILLIKGKSIPFMQKYYEESSLEIFEKGRFAD